MNVEKNESKDMKELTNQALEKDHTEMKLTESMEQSAVSLNFEEIVKQNRQRVYYQMQRLGIRDPHGDFYAEGLHAMWIAYQKYEPDKGPLATYFNYMIRNRLIDKMRKDVRDQENDEMFVEKEKQKILKGSGKTNLNGQTETLSKKLEQEEFWNEIRSILTENQWNWVYYYVIQDMPLKEIAELKGVSVEAVKSWAKGARRKLRGIGWDEVSSWMRD